ncbi:MAG TPA: ABC transporter ATP-binding protein [Solirubrobacteraceae bacterium]|nr:ABC transporter ATP-binding protein [Solirubrobacteraceae bacterium]
MTVIRARSVVKRYEQNCALDGVSLAVEEGEVRGLLGPNGAGKTTLLRILFGLIRPDAGVVELFDRPLAPERPGALDGVGGFVEDPSFYPYLSGRVNLELLAELDGGLSRDRIEEVLERVGLTPRAHDRVSGYSTGMIQRLGIAAALLRAPRLLMLDEPTAGLDPGGVREIASLVRELSADGVTVLLSSHQIVEVEEICHSFTVLRKGQVAWDGPAALLRSQAPASAYRLLTSDDDRALSLAEGHAGVGAVWAEGGGLELTVEGQALDRFVLELGGAGVAIRRLELLASPVETMFFALTSEAAPARAESLGAGRVPADT